MHSRVQPICLCAASVLIETKTEATVHVTIFQVLIKSRCQWKGCQVVKEAGMDKFQQGSRGPRYS